LLTSLDPFLNMSSSGSSGAASCRSGRFSSNAVGTRKLPYASKSTEPLIAAPFKSTFVVELSAESTLKKQRTTVWLFEMVDLQFK
jgi:hypothetical protein